MCSVGFSSSGSVGWKQFQAARARKAVGVPGSVTKCAGRANQKFEGAALGCHSERRLCPFFLPDVKCVRSVRSAKQMRLGLVTMKSVTKSAGRANQRFEG